MEHRVGYLFHSEGYVCIAELRKGFDRNADPVIFTTTTVLMAQRWASLNNVSLV